MPQSKLFSLIDKAVYDYGMIQSGDRILVGASGGKDSTALVEYFSSRVHRTKLPSLENEFHHKKEDIQFSFTPFYIQTDFSGSLSPKLTTLFSSWGTEAVTKKVDMLARLKKNEKMSCFWCSTQRRIELIDYALKNGYNKIALGHHLDDILETLLMNMIGHGKLETMPPVLQYKKYPLSVIRPLCYVSVSEIILHAEHEQWRSVTCTCSYQDNSGRKDARQKLAALTGGDDAKKMRMFSALKNIQTQYLP
jgi:tRNA(Ile)-lysidine synthase TilS/MesJ